MARDYAPYIWIAVAAGGGFLAWRAWQQHQVAVSEAIAAGTVAAPTVATSVPLLMPSVNLMAPAAINVMSPAPTATTTTTTTTPATTVAATTTAPAAANDTTADQNTIFANSMAAADASQQTYYDGVQASFIQAVKSGTLVPGTPDYAAQLAYAASRNGVAGQSVELAKLQAAGVA